jgi:hypothetical protein
VIVKPTRLRIHFPFHADLDLEAVPMHLPALMALGRTGQRLGGFEKESLWSGEPS